jgi:hypothetical protein
MLKLEILNHWIVPQQAKNPSEIDEEPHFVLSTDWPRLEWRCFKVVQQRPKGTRCLTHGVDFHEKAIRQECLKS